MYIAHRLSLVNIRVGSQVVPQKLFSLRRYISIENTLCRAYHDNVNPCHVCQIYYVKTYSILALLYFRA